MPGVPRIVASRRGRVVVTGLALLATLSLAAGARANTFSAFREVVRIQGPDSSNGGTGTLIGMRRVGNLLRLVFLTTDHTLVRVGPLQTIGFGDLATPAHDIDFPSSIDPIVYSKGPDGNWDISVIGVTIDLAPLAEGVLSYLDALAPVPFRDPDAPLALPFQFTAFGYGRFGTQPNPIHPDYGSQATFDNVVHTFEFFTGAYTDDGNGNPLVYSEELERFTFDAPATGDWVPGEGSGFGGYSGSPLLVPPVGGAGFELQGMQVAGSPFVPGAQSRAFRFTGRSVLWIEQQRDLYLDGASEVPALPLPSPILLALLLAATGPANRRRLRRSSRVAVRGLRAVAG